MNESFHIWQIILDAGLLVKLVLITLFALSFGSWVIVFLRKKICDDSEKDLTEFMQLFWSGIDISQLYDDIVSDRSRYLCGVHAIFTGGFKEYLRLRDIGISEHELFLQGMQRAINAAMIREEERLSSQLSFLATVGSVSPYIGLFGTVWGIMITLLNIVDTSGFNPTDVIPDLAEALIPTAFGLVAAIPAVVAYNRFAMRLDRLMRSYEAFNEEFINVLLRHG